MIASILTALATLAVPAHVHNLRVLDHGQPLRAVSDPAYDTCSRQVAFVDRRGYTVAEWVGCWNELDSYSHHKLTVTYRKA